MFTLLETGAEVGVGPDAEGRLWLSLETRDGTFVEVEVTRADLQAIRDLIHEALRADSSH